LLVHERIDLGFAVLTYHTVNHGRKRRIPFEKFLPPWYDVKASGDFTTGFERLLAMGEENERQLSQRSQR
jgi:hypothetical protein